MPIPKTELNKQKRNKNKAAGLVELRVWVTPEHKVKIVEMLSKLKEAQ